MRRLITGMFALLLGFGASLAAFQASEFARGEAVQGTKLGDLDFNRYCTTKYGERAEAVLISNDIYGWTCSFRKNEIFAARRVDADAACNALHDGNAYANAYDAHAPTSWQCFRGRRP